MGFPLSGYSSEKKRNGTGTKALSFIRDYARKKWPLKGSKHADNLYGFQVSGVRCEYLTSPFPDTRHLKPQFSDDMLSEKAC